jgi:hypothetical protein
VGNHLGDSSYYLFYVKLRNQTEPITGSNDGTLSPLPPLYENRAFVQDGKNWEAPLTFSIANFSNTRNESVLESLIINGVNFDVRFQVM